MSNTIEAIAEIEAGDLLIEMVVDCSLYHEPADSSVGIPGGFEADGYELVSIAVYDDGETIWESDSQGEIDLALTFITMAGHDYDDLIGNACEKEVSDFDPRDFF